jgi:hypothetical protein
VGTAHIESNASRQSQSRDHPLLSNGSVNTFPRRYHSRINNPLLCKTYNDTDNAIISATQRLNNEGIHRTVQPDVQYRVSAKVFKEGPYPEDSEEKGSLESETVRNGRESHGTRTRE